MRRFLALLLPMLLALAALCRPAMAQSEGPLVLAAASLQEAMTAAADGWAAKGHPRPRISFAASSALARQIEAGAPADMFVSADEPWMDEVQTKGLLRKGTRVSFLTNSLVLVAPQGRMQNIAIKPGFPLARALGNGRLAVGDPAAVPAGIYAKQALTRLAVWGFGQGPPRPGRKRACRAGAGDARRRPARHRLRHRRKGRSRRPRGGNIPGQFACARSAIRWPCWPPRVTAMPKVSGATCFSAEGKAVFRRFGFGTK